jgi:hypothetical protein
MKTLPINRFDGRLWRTTLSYVYEKGHFRPTPGGGGTLSAI